MSGRERYSGGYCGGVPPLPIPNREVKPAGADGTAYSGRVGRRRLRGQSFRVDPFFCARAGAHRVGICVPLIDRIELAFHN